MVMHRWMVMLKRYSVNMRVVHRRMVSNRRAMNNRVVSMRRHRHRHMVRSESDRRTAHRFKMSYNSRRRVVSNWWLVNLRRTSMRDHTSRASTGSACRDFRWWSVCKHSVLTNWISRISMEWLRTRYLSGHSINPFRERNSVVCIYIQASNYSSNLSLTSLVTVQVAER